MRLYWWVSRIALLVAFALTFRDAYHVGATVDVLLESACCAAGFAGVNINSAWLQRTQARRILRARYGREARRLYLSRESRFD